jgi:hypothetical protein
LTGPKKRPKNLEIQENVVRLQARMVGAVAEIQRETGGFPPKQGKAGGDLHSGTTRVDIESSFSTEFTTERLRTFASGSRVLAFPAVVAGIM